MPAVLAPPCLKVRARRNLRLAHVGRTEPEPIRLLLRLLAVLLQVLAHLGCGDRTFTDR